MTDIITMQEVAVKIGRTANHTSSLLTEAKGEYGLTAAGRGKYLLDDAMKQWINKKAGYYVYSMPYEDEYITTKVANGMWSEVIGKQLKHAHFLEIMKRREKEGRLEMDLDKGILNKSQFIVILDELKKEKAVPKIFVQPHYVKGELSPNHVRAKEMVEWALNRGVKESWAQATIKNFVKQGRLKKYDHGVYSRKDFESLKKDLAWNQ